jgi:hypothetical protein
MNGLGITFLLGDTEMDRKLRIIIEVNYSLVGHTEK